MPAILTHDFFGQDAYGPAIDVIPMLTPDERDAFLLGNQGPDPLFYLRLVPGLGDFVKLGEDMHHVPPTELFVTLRRAVDGLDEESKPVGRAYMAGFTCHYLLDRAVHPFVYFWERGLCQAGVEGLDQTDSGIVHAEVERDLDEMVLYAKRNQTVEVYRPYENVLRGRDDMLAILGDVYFSWAVGPLAEDEPSLNRVFPLAVSCFRIVQRLFWSPGQGKAALLGHVEHPMLHHRYSLVRAMSHRVRAEATSDFDNRDRRPWKDPFTGVVRDESFWDIYDATLAKVPEALRIALSDEFDEEVASSLTLGLNFCGERVE